MGYLAEAGLKLADGREDDCLSVWLQALGKDLQHAVKLVETNELMLAMDLVDAGQTAEPSAITLGIHADHDDLPSAVTAALLAEMLVFLKTHQL